MAVESLALETRRLIDQATGEGKTVHGLCSRLLKDFPYGVRLLVDRGVREPLRLDAEDLDDPDAYLSGRVVEAWQTQP